MDNSPGYNLCVLCCCSFGGGSPSTNQICRQDLLHFFKILVQSPPQFEGDVALSVNDFQRILNSSGLSVCGDCHTFVTVALETRSRAVQMEMNVRKLQMQILEQLRALTSELDLFHQEMTKIESVVKSSDESCLISHMPNKKTSHQVSQGVLGGQGNGVMVLRERILDVVTDLRIYQVSCTADTRLPVDESEVEAMWEDAQQLVECTPEITMDNYNHNQYHHQTIKREDDYDFANDSSGGPCSSLGEGEFTTATTPVLYMGHSVGTDYHVEGEEEEDNDNYNFNDSEEMDDDHDQYQAGTPTSQGQDQEHQMSIMISHEQDGGSPTEEGEGEEEETGKGGRRGGFFKEDVIHRALAREDTRTADMNVSTDPLRRFYLRYDPKRSKLFVGEVEVIINEVDETLQCSQCSIMGKRSKSNHQSKQSWRDMEKGILVHVIGKHLGGFQCQLCQEVFTSHTMIKKHNSKEHNGQMAIGLTGMVGSVGEPSPPVSSVSSMVSSPVTPKPVKPYQCSLCTSAFKKPSELKRHFVAKHSKFINQNEAETRSPPVMTSMVPSGNVSRRSGGGGGKRRRGVPVVVGMVASQGSPAGSGGGVSSGGGGSEKVIPTKSAKRPHECHICKYAFTKGSHLKRHLEVHRKRNELF